MARTRWQQCHRERLHGRASGDGAPRHLASHLCCTVWSAIVAHSPRAGPGRRHRIVRNDAHLDATLRNSAHNVTPPPPHLLGFRVAAGVPAPAATVLTPCGARHAEELTARTDYEMHQQQLHASRRALENRRRSLREWTPSISGNARRRAQRHARTGFGKRRRRRNLRGGSLIVHAGHSAAGGRTSTSHSTVMLRRRRQRTHRPRVDPAAHARKSVFTASSFAMAARV